MLYKREPPSHSGTNSSKTLVYPHSSLGTTFVQVKIMANSSVIIYLLLQAGFIAVAWGSAPHRDCGSWNGRLLNIEVEPCDQSVCVFRRGQNVTVHLQFLSEVNALSSWVALYGVTNPFFDYSFGTPEDFCRMEGIHCPLENANIYTLTATTYIKPTYPDMNADIKLRIYSDELWRDIICVQVPVKIIE